MNIVPAGFRRGESPEPWPPRPDECVVFVFGGSTTFGFGLPDDQTVVSALQRALNPQANGRRVRCYNFGRGYYFSTQERLLLESLLMQGFRPNVAVFIDGLNEFAYYDGVPELSRTLYHFTAPDLPPERRAPLEDDAARRRAVDGIIRRYAENIQLTQALCSADGVAPIFVGQPIPFLDFPARPDTYPFHSTYAEHRLAGWGYGRFKNAGRDGVFGDRFVWCGNAFAGANRIMYVDSIHYSACAADVLAACIVERSRQVDLLP